MELFQYYCIQSDHRNETRIVSHLKKKSVMAERNENASSNDSSITEDAKPRYSAKTTEYLSFPMLLLIFKYLSVYELLLRVGLVCKSWYHVARDRELWMTVNLTEQQKLKPRDLLKLLSFSNFRIIDLHLPHRGHEGRFSVHEERFLMLLLQKCQCLRVLQFCQRCWENLSTDAVQEVNSSLEIKFDHCAAHSLRGSLSNLLISIFECYHPLWPSGRSFHPFLSGLQSDICRRHDISNCGLRSFTDHTQSLMERRIILQDRKLEEKMQDANKSGNPKPSLRPYSNIVRQARKCPRQKYELRPPVNIVKQTKSYHQPRKRQIKRSGQKHTKQ